MANKKKKPPKCCAPDCFNCPYVECRYSGMEIEDYLDGTEVEEFVNPISSEDARNREYQRKYRERHPNEIKQRRKKYYDENSARCIKKSNEWKRENRDRVNASIRAKYAKNKEYYRQKQREYRARKRREAVVDGERNEAV